MLRDDMRYFLSFFLSTLLFIFFTACTLSQTHLQRGKNYLDKKKYVQAIGELEKAANEEGDIYYYIDTYSYLGDAYANNGEIPKAISIYRNAVQIIHLRLREISAQRRDIRKSLNAKSNSNAQNVQEEDMRLADEEWKLTEVEKDIQSRLKRVKGKM